MDCGREAWTDGQAAVRPRPRRVRRMGRWSGTERFWPVGGPCPVCGEEAPAYRVETADHTPLGCERCLTIYREGVMQL